MNSFIKVDDDDCGVRGVVVVVWFVVVVGTNGSVCIVLWGMGSVVCLPLCVAAATTATEFSFCSLWAGGWHSIGQYHW